MSNQQMVIQPIDALILDKFVKRVSKVFQAKCAFLNANDKTRILNRVFGQGGTLTYPYIYLEILNISANTESYNPHQFARRGVVLQVNTDQTVQTVRVIPTNFEIKLTYVTNEFYSVAPGSTLAFARRWLLARRDGWLKESVDYGRLQFGIGVTMADSIPIPQRENVTESETKFETDVSLTLHGYTSEPVLGEIGKVNEFQVNEQVGGTRTTTTPVIVSTQTFAFPEKE